MLIRKAQPEKKKRKKWQWPYREERKKEYESAPFLSCQKFRCKFFKKIKSCLKEDRSNH